MATDETVRRPNILILYPDQMRADAMSCAGTPAIKTPHFDRLASEGVRFTQAYTAFPLCCPFRASLMTGVYPHTNGMYANHYPIPLGQGFLAETLRQAGYQTGYVGKWHLDGGIKHGYVPPGPRRLGFDYFVGFNRGHEYVRSIYYYDGEQPYTSPATSPTTRPTT